MNVFWTRGRSVFFLGFSFLASFTDKHSRLYTGLYTVRESRLGVPSVFGLAKSMVRLQ